MYQASASKRTKRTHGTGRTGRTGRWRVLKPAAAWLRLAAGTVAVAAICWLTAQYAFHLRLLDVQTGSMRPAFRPHDALVLQRINPGRLRVGMVVSYHSSRNPGELVTHRVTRIFPDNRGFQTKGDALTAPDPAVQNAQLAGRVVAVLPGLGGPLGWLQTWPGLALCVYTPAVAIALSELRRFEHSLDGGRQTYRLRET